jgi:hypothetical protein
MLESRARELLERMESAKERGTALADRERQLETRTRELIQREANVMQQEEGLRKQRDAADAARQDEAKRLAERGAALTAREKVLSAAERVLQERSAALQARVRQQRLREDRLAEHARPGLVPGAPARGRIDDTLVARARASGIRNTSEPSALGVWNIRVLSGLVEENARDFPSWAEEWRAYLGSLREFADSAGQLPPTFDSLVLEVFEPLLDRIGR